MTSNDKMVLKVRETTKLSGPLQAAVDSGDIILVRMSNQQLLDAAAALSN